MNRLILAVMLAAGSARADDAPAWLAAAAALDSTSVAGSAHAVDLLREVVVTVQEDGRQRWVERRAVRILSPGGRSYAVGRVVYSLNEMKVKRLEGWVMGTGAAVVTLGKRETADVALAGEDFYNEVRVRGIVAPRVEPGFVFGWEGEWEREPLFGDVVAELQGTLPVVRSRFAVAIPPGWMGKARAANLPGLESKRDGAELMWEVTNRPAVEVEPMGPSPSSALPRVAIGLQPPPGSAVPTAFKEWNDVGNWLRPLSEQQVEPSAEIRAKAIELTAGKSSEWERIEPIARFVQGVRYVSIQTGLGRGGGYRPHAASEVMARLRGDCKDKATLMRSLLRAVGIGSRLVLISTEDGYVREDWPTPQQFNHAIIAVEVSSNVKADALVDSPASGRLLLFDPTDAAIPLGRLPANEQDNLALVVTAAGAVLIRTNSSDPASTRYELSAQYTLSPLGGLKARLKEERLGDAAAAVSILEHEGGFERLKEAMSSYVGRSVPGAKFATVQMGFLPTGDWRMEVDFEAQEYAKLLQQRIMVFRAPDFGVGDTGMDRTRPRRLPIRLTGHSVVSRSVVTLPPGFTVDEIPGPVSHETEFGRFAATWAGENGQIRIESRLEMPSRRLPAGRAGEVLDFLHKMRESIRAPVVLLKK